MKRANIVNSLMLTIKFNTFSMKIPIRPVLIFHFIVVRTHEIYILNKLLGIQYIIVVQKNL